MNNRFLPFSWNYFNFALRNYKRKQEIIFRKNTTIVPNDKSRITYPHISQIVSYWMLEIC